jgi:hypothetical protein
MAMPPVPRRHGRPPGSHNKKTLEALTAAAAAESVGAASAALAIATTAGAVATTDATTAGAGGSTSAAATVVRKPRRPPPEQRLSYTSEHGFTTFVVHLRAGCEVRLPLPFKFIDTLGETPLMGTIVEEGSGGQPLYPIEILHDDQGKTYLTAGWTRFIDDYDLKCGWSLIFTRCIGSPFLCVHIVDTSGCARAYSPWP